MYPLGFFGHFFTDILNINEIRPIQIIANFFCVLVLHMWKNVPSNIRFWKSDMFSVWYFWQFLRYFSLLHNFKNWQHLRFQKIVCEYLHLWYVVLKLKVQICVEYSFVHQSRKLGTYLQYFDYILSQNFVA